MIINSKENHSVDDNPVPEIKELEIMFTGMTGFALEIKRHLTEMISTGRISRTKTVNSEELLQKMWTVYTENELPVFLKKLEYANARDSYLKSVIAEFTMKYTSEIKTQQHDKTEHSEPVKPLSFMEMLKEMQYPDKYYMDSEIFDDEDSYYDYFGDDDEEERKMCIIPDSFRNSQETMERALKFLGGYYWIVGDCEDYRKFADETYRTLARIICTGKVGRNRTVSVSLLIRRLNEINADKYENDDSINDFMQSFHRHFQNKLTEYSDISNKKAYMEAMLVSFLDGEYQENNIRGEMLLNQFIRSIGKQMPESCMEEHTTEINTAEKSMITDTEPEKSESEYAEEITDMPEPEEVVKNLHEEHDVSETEIVPTSETFAEVIDIAETSTEEPDENSSVTENIQSETSAESITEIPTEEVDVISEIPIPIKAPAQKTETFTITDEMRKHFFKDLFGNDLSDEQIEIHRKEQINQRRNQEYIIFRNHLCIA